MDDLLHAAACTLCLLPAVLAGLAYIPYRKAMRDGSDT